MSRLEVPVVFRRLSTTGDELVRAELKLAIKINRGAWEANASSNRSCS